MAITCQRIVDRDIFWPEDLPEDAKDLIDKLLTVDITQRFGCGYGDSPFAPEKIRDHRFFKGIDFNNLQNITPPIIPDELSHDGPVGVGINVSMYDLNLSELNFEDEDVLLKSHVIPKSFYNRSNHINILFKGGMFDSIRRSNIIREVFPELKRLPSRPTPVILDFTDQNVENVEEPMDDDVEPPEPDTVGDDVPSPPAHSVSYRVRYLKTVASVPSPVRRISCSSDCSVVAVSGCFVMQSYGLTFQGDNISVDLIKSEYVCSSSSFLSYSPDGTALVFDMKRKVGLIKQKGDKKGANGHSVQHSSDLLSGHHLPILCASWAPDNSTLAVGGMDGVVYIWDTRKQKCLLRIHKCQGTINHLDWQSSKDTPPDQLPLLASAGSDGRINIINPNNGEVVKHLHHHKCHEVLSVIWSPVDPHLMVSYSQDKTLVFINTSDYSVKVFAQPTCVQHACFSPNGKYLATVSTDVIRIWDVTPCLVLKAIPRNGTGSSEVHLSSRGGMIFPILSFDCTSTRLACTTSHQDQVPVIFDMVSNSFLSCQSREASSTHHVSRVGQIKTIAPHWQLRSLGHTVGH